MISSKKTLARLLSLLDRDEGRHVFALCVSRLKRVKKVSPPPAGTLPFNVDILSSITLFFDAKSVAAASTASSEFKAACERGGDALWRSLALNRFPILRPLDALLSPQAFKEQYKKQATYKEILPPPTLISVEAFSNFAFSCELRIYGEPVLCELLDRAADETFEVAVEVPVGKLLQLSRAIVAESSLEIRVQVLNKAEGTMCHFYDGKLMEETDGGYLQFECMAARFKEAVVSFYDEQLLSDGGMDIIANIEYDDNNEGETIHARLRVSCEWASSGVEASTSDVLTYLESLAEFV